MSTAESVLRAAPTAESVLGAAPNLPSWRQDVYAPISLAFLGLVFLYSCLRAARLSIVHDEAITYFIQLLNSFAGIMTYTHPLMPNNHFLNTLLVKIFTGLFGSSEFVIRLPALLGGGLYLTAIYRICRVFLRGPRLLLAVGLLALHPFLLDFFSCARGYALALGLLAMGLYYLLCRIKEAGSRRDGRNTFGAASLSALAVFAHMTFINIYGAMLCVLVGLEVRDAFFSGRQPGTVAPAFRAFLKRVVVSIVPGILLLSVVLIRPAMNMVRDSELRMLENDGFWQGTVRSLVEATAYGKPSFPQDAFFAALIVILAAAGLFCLTLGVRWLMKKPLGFLDRFLLCLGALLLVVSTGLIVQHKVLKLAYPLDRWALYYFPVFMLLVLVLTEEARRNRRVFIRVPGTALFYLFSSALCLHYVSCLNLTHYYVWKYDATTREMLDMIWELEKDDAPADHSIRLDSEWLFDRAIGFYVFSKRLWWLDAGGHAQAGAPPDYYYYSQETKDLLYLGNLELIKKFDVSGAWLARPKTKRRRAPAGTPEKIASGSGMSAKEHDKEMAEKFLDGFAVYGGPMGYLKRGRGWAQIGKREAAISDFSKAIELDPDSYAAYLNRGMVYFRAGAPDKALADINEALLIKPFLPEGLDAHGCILSQEKEYAGALRDFNRSIDLDPDRPEAYHHRGLVYAAMGETERALEDFDRTLDLDPSCSAASYNRALLYLGQGRMEEAVADLTRVIEAEPDKGPAYQQRGRAYEVLGDTERAKRDLEKARELSR